MFENAELDHKFSKAQYEKEEPKLRMALLDAQVKVSKAARFPVLLLIGGVEGAGKGETVNLLHEWMDPRHLLTYAFGEPSDEERERPYMWRFWRALPPKGRIGIFFGGWHSQPILDRAMGHSSKGEFDSQITQIRMFERMLTDEGVLLLKLWFHLSKKQQKHRLEQLESDKKTRWRVGEEEWGFFKRYDQFAQVNEHYLRATNTAEAPWVVIPGADPQFRAVTVGRTVLTALQERLDAKSVKAPSHAHAAPAKRIDKLDPIRALKLDQPLDKDEYRDELLEWQGRLNQLSRHKRFKKRAVVMVFEGNDAAGKGGAIRRVTQALDARYYRGFSIAAPTEEERAQPYLWRFWRHIPRRGRFAIFDRSWYGRVLVERVEGFCSEPDWMRAYSEITQFEEQLHDSKVLVLKFWLAISKTEQLHRFKSREEIEFKRFKITDEDWRNRKKWDAYEQAVVDMIERTSTELAPWTLVEANNKYFARIKVLKTVVKRLEEALD
ncbi:MAG: polyphosphate:AMP phosphotransferase [Myxococcaceae bacterium]